VRRPRGDGAEVYRTRDVPNAGLDWREAPFCAVDLELTGLNAKRDEIISFAAVPVEGGRVQLGEIVAGYVRPGREMGEAAIRIHGIRPADLERAPKAPEALDPLFGALAGRIAIAHVADVERPFLKRALREVGVRMHRQIIDTQQLGMLWNYEREGSLGPARELAALADSLSLPVHRMHDAATDALTTAQAFIALATLLSKSEPQTVGRLCGADRRVAALRVFAAHG